MSLSVKRFFPLLAILLWAFPVIAGDLDDGISSYTDDPIGAADELGSPEINVGFIVLQAKARAASVMPTSELHPVTEATGNINSVVVEAGSTVTGDIIVIDNSIGDKSLIISTAIQEATTADPGLGL